MCFDEPTSWTTFIIGSALNYWYFLRSKNRSLFAVGIMWQYILFVQALEALIWRSYKTGNQNLCQFSSNAIMTTTMMQPLLAILLAAYAAGQQNVFTILVATMYAVFFVYHATKTKGDRCIISNERCNGHLDHVWWDEMGSGARTLYFAGLLFAFVIFRPVNLGLIIAAFISVTIMITRYMTPCAFASMWCWLAASGPLIISLLY